MNAFFETLDEKTLEEIQATPWDLYKLAELYESCVENEFTAKRREDISITFPPFIQINALDFASVTAKELGAALSIIPYFAWKDFLKKLNLHDNLGTILCKPAANSYLDLFGFNTQVCYWNKLLELPGVGQALSQAIIEGDEEEETYLSQVLLQFPKNIRVEFFDRLVAPLQESLVHIIHDIDDIQSIMDTLPANVRSYFLSNEIFYPVYTNLCTDPQNIIDLIQYYMGIAHFPMENFNPEEVSYFLSGLHDFLQHNVIDFEILDTLVTSFLSLKGFKEYSLYRYEDEAFDDRSLYTFLLESPIFEAVQNVVKNKQFHTLGSQLPPLVLGILLGECEEDFFISDNPFAELWSIVTAVGIDYFEDLDPTLADRLIHNIHWSGYKVSLMYSCFLKQSPELATLSYQELLNEYPALDFITPELDACARESLRLMNGNSPAQNMPIILKLYSSQPNSIIFADKHDFRDRYQLFNAMDHLPPEVWPRLLALPGMEEHMDLSQCDLDEIENVLDCFLEDTLPSFLRYPGVFAKILSPLTADERQKLLTQYDEIQKVYEELNPRAGLSRAQYTRFHFFMSTQVEDQAEISSRANKVEYDL